MASVKRIVLDVLKPHHPSVLEFAGVIAEQETVNNVNVTVVEIDEKTETLVVTIEGENIQFDAIADAIKSLGGSLHSVDEVEVTSEAEVN